jgi:hypothetical protein
MKTDYEIGFNKGYQQAVRDELNKRVNLTEFNKKFRRELCQLYREAPKRAGETLEDWTERMLGLESKVMSSHKERQQLGISMTRSWEVPHSPGIKAYDFIVDWEEIDRDLKERRLLRYIQNKRLEYSNAN